VKRTYSYAPPGMDPARGSFFPSEKRAQRPLRPGKTREDRMAAEMRPRVLRAKARAGRA
jgi:hypothetical protein